MLLIAQMSFWSFIRICTEQTEKRKFSLVRCEFGEKYTITNAERKRTVIHSACMRQSEREIEMCVRVCGNTRKLFEQMRAAMEERQAE